MARGKRSGSPTGVACTDGTAERTAAFVSEVRSEIERTARSQLRAVRDAELALLAEQREYHPRAGQHRLFGTYRRAMITPDDDGTYRTLAAFLTEGIHLQRAHLDDVKARAGGAGDDDPELALAAETFRALNEMLDAVGGSAGAPESPPQLAPACRAEAQEFRLAAQLGAVRAFLERLRFQAGGPERAATAVAARELVGDLSQFAAAPPSAAQVDELARFAAAGAYTEYPLSDFAFAAAAIADGTHHCDEEAPEGDRHAWFIRNSIRGGADTPRSFLGNEPSDYRTSLYYTDASSRRAAMRAAFRFAIGAGTPLRVNERVSTDEFVDLVDAAADDLHHADIRFVVVHDPDGDEPEVRLTVSRGATVNGCELEIHSFIHVEADADRCDSPGLWASTPASVREALKRAEHFPPVDTAPMRQPHAEEQDDWDVLAVEVAEHFPTCAVPHPPASGVNAFIRSPPCNHPDAGWVLDVADADILPVAARLECMSCSETHVKCIPRHCLPASHRLSAARLDQSDAPEYMNAMRYFDALEPTEAPVVTPRDIRGLMARDGTISPTFTRYDYRGEPRVPHGPGASIGVRSISDAVRRR